MIAYWTIATVITICVVPAIAYDIGLSSQHSLMLCIWVAMGLLFFGKAVEAIPKNKGDKAQ